MAKASRNYYTTYELAYILANGELPDNPTVNMDDPKYFRAIEGAINAGWLKTVQFASYRDELDALRSIWESYGLEFCEVDRDILNERELSLSLLAWKDIRAFLDRHEEFGRPTIFYPELNLLGEDANRPRRTIADCELQIFKLEQQISLLQEENQRLLGEIETYRPLSNCLNTNHPAHSNKLANAIKIWNHVYGHLRTEEEVGKAELLIKIDEFERKNAKLKEKDAIKRVITPERSK